MPAHVKSEFQLRPAYKREEFSLNFILNDRKDGMDNEGNSRVARTVRSSTGLHSSGNSSGVRPGNARGICAPQSSSLESRTRHRSWLFTINNWTDEDVARMDTLPAKYVIFGKEIAPSTGTPHLQCYVVFESAKTRSAVSRLLPRAFLLAARGSHSDNIRYCSKDGQFTEIGDRPRDPCNSGKQEIDRWDLVWVSAKRGDLEEVPADIRIRCYNSLRRIERDFAPPVEALPGTCGIWIYGLCGAGKTSSVVDTYPFAYPKPLSKWWCGYQREEVVFLDDIDLTATNWIGRFLKIWADRYSFVAESKHGSMKIRPKKFFVTSQYTIEEIFHEEREVAALKRRFVVINKIHGQNIII